MEPSRQNVVRFGTFEVSFRSGELRKSGMKIKVQQQPLKMLELLLEHPGEVVTRSELRGRIWSGEEFGDFDQAVNIAVAKLRTALGDSAENPRYIETIPKLGYRFIAPATVIDTDARPELAQNAPTVEAPHKAEPPAKEPVSHKKPMTFAALGVVVLALAVAGFVYWRVHQQQRVPPHIESLAVLPLENFSGDPAQDYFAEGMTDALITDLAQIKAVRVISRTSVMGYRGAHRPLPEIARELKVDGVVEGSVQRIGDRVRITAQLIEARSDRHIWAQTYEEDVRDTLGLQKKVASAIAEQIRIEVTPEEQAVLKRSRAVNPEAYESYLKGRYFWNKRTTDGLQAALTYFARSIDLDPKYAPAYAGLADCYNLLGDWEYGVLAPAEAYPKAKAAALKAIELDDGLSEAHTSLAFSFDVFDWDWNSAEREYRRAIELNPGYATAHQWYADHLSELGRHDEALTEMRKAAHLDPLSLIISAEIAGVLLEARRYDEAIEQSRRTIEMDPNFAVAHLELGQAFVQEHRYKEAIAEFQNARALSGHNVPCSSNLAYAYALDGRRDDALNILKDVMTRSARDTSDIALIYTGLGNKDSALNWLERGLKEHSNPSLLQRPVFDSLRGEVRFQSLLRQVGLPN